MRDSIYTPGAGHRPPVLAGRDEIVRAWQLMLNDVDARGRVRARDTILAGPRGIGKTATVFQYGDLCREEGYEVVNLQAATGNPTLIDSLVRQAERRADAGAGPWQRAKRAFERIAAINVNVAGIGGGISTHPPNNAPHPVAPEDLADALAQLAHEVRAERLNGDHADARVIFAGTALPHITDVLSQAGVTHADRLLYIRQLPLTLTDQDALYAIVRPAQEANVAWQPEAAELIVKTTNGYPAHLQLFADHAWTAAQNTTITLQDSRTREELLTQGDIYAPGRGEMALTVPLMSPYLLAQYEQIRTRATAALLPLEEMQRNVDAIAANRATHEATSPATTRAARPQPARYTQSSRYPDPNTPTRRPSR
jgi:hypothetical protein